MVAGFAGSAPGRTKAPRNAWYVVVFSDEIAEKPLARTILGDRVVMYRTSSGKPVVLADRRGLYLDLGERTPDVSVRADEAAVRFRRVLEQQLLREAPAVPDSAGRLQVTVAG